MNYNRQKLKLTTSFANIALVVSCISFGAVTVNLAPPNSDLVYAAELSTGATYIYSNARSSNTQQSNNARFENLLKDADALFDRNDYRKAAKAYERAGEYGAAKNALPINEFLQIADSAIAAMTLAQLREKRVSTASRFIGIMDDNYPDSEETVAYLIRVRKMLTDVCDDSAALKLSTRIENKIAKVRSKDQVGYWNIIWRELLYRLSVFNPQIALNSFNKANSIYADSQDYDVDPRNKIYAEYHRTLFRDTLSTAFKGPRNKQLERTFGRLFSANAQEEYKQIVDTDWGSRLLMTHPETLSTVKYYSNQRLAELAILRKDQETGRAYINDAAALNAPTSIVDVPLFGAAPRYKKGAQINGIEAKGSARLEIDQFGRVTGDPNILDFNGNDIAESAWGEAIKRMTFVPGFQDGAPTSRVIPDFRFGDEGLEACYLEVNKRGLLRTVWVSLVGG